MDPVELVEASSDLAPHERYYWRYQFELGREVLVPQLARWGAFAPGMRVFEFGCGEAGVLDAFAASGAREAVGVDIAPYRIQVGQRIAELCGLPVELHVCNLLTEPMPSGWQHHFHLVILRDVIEHLDDADHALTVVRELLLPGGHVLVTFPPYYSPYGGHQHLLQTRAGMLPWVHLLPEPLFEHIIQRSSRPADRDEVRRLRRIRLTTRRFERAAARVGFAIERKELYLLRPVFRFKFGIPPLRLPRWTHRLPFVDAIATEALYVLRSA